MPKYKHKKKYELYLDESGTVGGQDGIITLAGLIVEKRYRINELDNRLEQFKSDTFNNTNIILHLVDILKRQKEFSQSKISSDQIDKFYKNTSTFLKELDVIIISSTVDTARLKKFYKNHKDEYSVAFNHIMKSVYHFLDNNEIESLDIYFEGRDESQNFIVQKSFFESYYSGGTHLDIGPEIKNKIKRFTFIKKEENLSGLQIIDLLCFPIKKIRTEGYFQTEKRKDLFMNDVFDSVLNKFYVPDGMIDIKNWSLKKIPIVKSPGSWSKKC